MGNALFTCVLTDAQVEAFSAATAAVLSEKVHEDYGVTDDMARIWSVSEVTLEDNVLTAAVPRKHLCVVDSDTGAILADDLDHVTDADGTLMVRAVYRPYSQYAESLSVVYHLKVDPETDKVTVAAIYEQQDARYTQRTPVSRRRLQSEKWETVSFTTDLRCPVYINGALAGYDDWTKAEGVENNV
ncbi:MAG: hypothetical protein MJ099_06825, partial [Clostridia bacterium]|nr:hypothetical protein [Clostridia bacterium]